MTRALARLEQTAESMESDWNLLYERQQNWSRWNNWSGSWCEDQGSDGYESDDGQHREHVFEMRMRKMEEGVIIPYHEQSTKDLLPDVIRGWLVLQRSGLSESSKKTVLGSTQNTLGISRIVEALKRQWPDHELLVHDGEGLRSRKSRRMGPRRRIIKIGNRQHLEHERVDGCV